MKCYSKIKRKILISSQLQTEFLLTADSLDFQWIKLCTSQQTREHLSTSKKYFTIRKRGNPFLLIPRVSPVHCIDVDILASPVTLCISCCRASDGAELDGEGCCSLPGQQTGLVQAALTSAADLPADTANQAFHPVNIMHAILQQK